MLLDCRACDEQRTLFFEKVAAALNGAVGVTLHLLAYPEFGEYTRLTSFGASKIILPIFSIPYLS